MEESLIAMKTKKLLLLLGLLFLNYSYGLGSPDEAFTLTISKEILNNPGIRAILVTNEDNKVLHYREVEKMDTDDNYQINFSRYFDKKVNLTLFSEYLSEAIGTYTSCITYTALPNGAFIKTLREERFDYNEWRKNPNKVVTSPDPNIMLATPDDDAPLSLEPSITRRKPLKKLEWVEITINGVKKLNELIVDKPGSKKDLQYKLKKGVLSISYLKPENLDLFLVIRANKEEQYRYLYLDNEMTSMSMEYETLPNDLLTKQIQLPEESVWIGSILAYNPDTDKYCCIFQNELAKGQELFRVGDLQLFLPPGVHFSKYFFKIREPFGNGRVYEEEVKALPDSLSDLNLDLWLNVLKMERDTYEFEYNNDDANYYIVKYGFNSRRIKDMRSVPDGSITWTVIGPVEDSKPIKFSFPQNLDYNPDMKYVNLFGIGIWRRWEIKIIRVGNQEIPKYPDIANLLINSGWDESWQVRAMSKKVNWRIQEQMRQTVPHQEQGTSIKFDFGKKKDKGKNKEGNK